MMGLATAHLAQAVEDGRRHDAASRLHRHTVVIDDALAPARRFARRRTTRVPYPIDREERR
jgi:hypothetical protein